MRRELQAGEELWYAGMPSPAHTGRRMWPIAVFGLFFGGFAAFWITMAAAGTWFGGAQSGGGAGSGTAPGIFMLFPLFGLPFLLDGLGMIASPWWAAGRARRSVCCVISRRAMQIRCGSTIRVQSWSPDDLTEITKSMHADGTGTLLFARSQVAASRGRSRTVAIGFNDVPDPRAREEALLALRPAIERGA